MFQLLLVSLIWAFSFGLTKGILSNLDSAWVSAGRLLFAGLVFLPFWKPSQLAPFKWLRFMLVGAVQFGLMYLLYNESYHHLRAYEVALFTLSTPILVALIGGIFERRWQLSTFVAALLAVLAGALVTYRSSDVSATLEGLLLVQGANLCFALGQLWYRAERKDNLSLPDHKLFAALYLGAIVVTVPTAWWHSHGVLPDFTAKQAYTLLYLGIVASGLGFFLWNRGASAVSTGTLAAMNNAKVPLAILCSLLFFGESAEWTKLGPALALLSLAVVITEKRSP